MAWLTRSRWAKARRCSMWSHHIEEFPLKVASTPRQRQRARLQGTHPHSDSPGTHRCAGCRRETRPRAGLLRFPRQRGQGGVHWVPRYRQYDAGHRAGRAAAEAGHRDVLNYRDNLTKRCRSPQWRRACGDLHALLLRPRLTVIDNSTMREHITRGRRHHRAVRTFETELSVSNPSEKRRL